MVWIPSTRASASSSVGHGASVFTGDFLACHSHNRGLAGSLRHVGGFPVLGLLRTLRPIPGPSADGGPARRRAGCTVGRAIPGWFPRSPCSGRQDRRPALPLRSRRGYAADLRRGLPVGINDRRPSRLPCNEVDAHRCPARIHQVPGPSGSAGPSRRCQGCFPPSRAPPRSGCPQLHRTAATARRGGSLTRLR